MRGVSSPGCQCSSSGTTRQPLLKPRSLSCHRTTWAGCRVPASPPSNFRSLLSICRVCEANSPLGGFPAGPWQAESPLFCWEVLVATCP